MSGDLNSGFPSFDAIQAPDSNTALVRQPQSPSDPTQTGKPEQSEAQKNLVTEWQKKVLAARDKFNPDFLKMRENMHLARTGKTKEWNGYTVPLTARHINQKVATLYARKPTVSATVKRKVLFKVWDEDPVTFKAAAQGVMMAAQMGQPPDPNAVAIIQEVEQAKNEQLMLRRMAKTAEIVADYFISPRPFKRRMKQMVRRSCITKVGYIDLSFQRQMEPDPAITAQIDGHISSIRHLRMLAEQVQAGETDEFSPRVAELENLVADLRTREQVIVREGPVFDFPRSSEIIVDPNCRQLHGFDGADWLARQWLMSPDRVKELFDVDIGQKYTVYKNGISSQDTSKNVPNMVDPKGQACVWRVQDKVSGQEFFIADGYDDWIKPPAAPSLSLDRFFTVFSFVVNDVEDDEKLYPPSDVEWMESAQNEMNQVRQALSDHRRANVPGWIAGNGMLDVNEKQSILDRVPFQIITAKQLTPGTKVGDLMAPIPTIPIDINMYSDKPIMDDVERAVGTQDATLGPAQSNTTATSVSVAESSRQSANGSNLDDLDDLLSELLESVHEANLLNLSMTTVQKIAGLNAVWPDSAEARTEAIEKLALRVQAGSSGRINAAATLANMERAAPYLLQVPGVNTMPFWRLYFETLDLPVDEMAAEGAPSIVALNAMASAMPPAAHPEAGGGAPQPGPAGSPRPPGGQPAHAPGNAGPGARPMGHPNPVQR